MTGRQERSAPQTCGRWPRHILLCLMCKVAGYTVCQLPCANACECTGAR